MIAKIKADDLPFYLKTDFVADTNDVLWHVYKQLKNGSEKLVKSYKTRAGGINGARMRNLGYYQKQGYTGYDIVKGGAE